MAQSFIPAKDPYNITLPAGMQVVQTSQGGTAYILNGDPSNVYVPVNGGYQLAPNIKAASAPIAMNGPAPVPTNNGSTAPIAGNIGGISTNPASTPQLPQTIDGGSAVGTLTLQPDGKTYKSATNQYGNFQSYSVQDAQSRFPTQFQQNQTTGTGGAGDALSTLNGMGSVGQQLAQLLGSLTGPISKLSELGQIPPGLQITPALTSQFLQWAHQVVDPQTQQLIQQHITSLNSDLQNKQTDYENSKAGLIQDFGTNLATAQNTAGASGTAFSGLRNLTEQNMAASTNRSLSTLSSDAQNNIGQELNAGAAAVGSENAGQFNMPSLLQGSVSNIGGSRGSSSNGQSLNFNYNPSNYAVGTDISSGNTALQGLYGKYVGDYGTLAGNSPATRSMSDLIGQMGPELPKGYSIPANLS